MEWKDGYLIDSEYVYTFWSVCAPSRLAFTAALNGVTPPALERCRVLELGCGQGFQAALLAAANPGAEVVAVDFNPGHVANAERLREAARLENVAFLCASFDELLERPPEGFGGFDFVILHGVWSWIGAPVRESLLRLVRAAARPGALVYLCYNALPGCAAVAGLQTFLVEHARRHPGRGADQVMAGFAAAARLHAPPASFFRTHPVEERVRGANPAHKHYLAHEYLHRDWRAFHFHEVEAAFAAQGFAFAGACQPQAVQPALCEAPDTLALLPETDDRTWRITVEDYIHNRQLRTDIFHLDAPPLNGIERERHLGGLRYAAAQPVDGWDATLAAASGLEILGAAAFEDVKAAFRAGFPEGHAFADLLARHGSPHDLPTLLAVLVGRELVEPALPGAVDPAPARRFNRMVVAERPFGERFAQIASPVTGNAMALRHVTALAMETRHIRSLDARIAAAEALLAERGEALLHGGRRLTDPVAQRQELAQWFVRYADRSAPLIESLGLLPDEG